MLSLNLLQRITSGNKKILYIDGLRFFAVISVFVAHFVDYYGDTYSVLDQKHNISKHESISSAGVYLFFAISGFIIALPFIKQYVYNGSKISMKNYFIRRITRLEPPYIILLTLLFIMQVFVLKTKSFDFLFPYYLASLFYIHKIIYNEMPIINPLLWTLEIEIQFYILAPIFALTFKSKKLIRRTMLILIIVFWDYINFVQFEFSTLSDYLSFFLIGFLAADFYLDYKEKYKNHIIYDFICISSIIVLFTYPSKPLLLLASFLLLITSSKSLHFIKFLEKKSVYIIGGMCYSIYMLHQKLIYIFSDIIFSKIFFINFWIDFTLKLILMTFIVLIVSSIFFVFVERPTMKKEWWKYKSFKKLFFE